MTPDAIRVLSQLRQEFYALFAVAMEVPVRVTNKNSYCAVAYWIDAKQRLNYLRIFAHTAPDELGLKRPLTLRLAINVGEDITVLTKHRRDSQELNRDWSFELTLLPEEVLDFIPWIVSLIRSYNTNSASVVLEPPYPLNFQLSNNLLFNNTRTQEANRRLS
jgi:hypothetical protein